MKKRNLALVAGTQRRHQKGYIETIKKIQDGAIGNVISARVAWNSGGPTPIWFHGREKGEPDTTYQLRNWYHYLWLCGDHIVEQHVHNLDVANWVIGDHPIRAQPDDNGSNEPEPDDRLGYFLNRRSVVTPWIFGPHLERFDRKPLQLGF